MIPFLIWIQGEEDAGRGREWYVEQLINLQRCLAESIMTLTGQVEEPLLYAQQRSRSATGFAAPFKMHQAYIDAPRRHSKIRYLGPNYDLRFPAGSHMDAPGYYLDGLRIAEQIYDDYFCNGRGPFAPSNWYWIAPDKIRLEYLVFRPIVLDTSNEIINTTGLNWGKPTNGYGFEFDDGSGNSNTSPYVTAVTLVDDGSPTSPSDGALTDGMAIIDITLSFPPSASSGPRRLCYAGKNTTPDSDYANGNGRGCIRDTSTATAPILRDGTEGEYPLYNWAARFEIFLP
jgi:hypothetical protein